MDKNDMDKTRKDESCLNVGDWVTFLSSEKHGMMGTALAYGAFLVALIAIILGGTGEGPNWLAIGGGIIALVIVGIGYSRVLAPAGRRAKLAQKILERVLSGELRDESSIRREWEAGQAALNRPRRCRRRSGK